MPISSQIQNKQINESRPRFWFGLFSPTEDAGEHCRARAKLNEHALHELACTVAVNTEAEADESWLLNGRHAKLVDGFAFTMPDTR